VVVVGDDCVGVRVLQQLIALGVPVRAVAVTGDAPAARSAFAGRRRPGDELCDRHQSRPRGARRRAGRSAFEVR
jgi:hypothetical protein